MSTPTTVLWGPPIPAWAPWRWLVTRGWILAFVAIGIAAPWSIGTASTYHPFPLHWITLAGFVFMAGTATLAYVWPEPRVVATFLAIAVATMGSRIWTMALNETGSLFLYTMWAAFVWLAVTGSTMTVATYHGELARNGDQ